jgi:hypothetical protein
MEIPDALAPELLALGHFVLRSLVALSSITRMLRAPRARLRAQLEPPTRIPHDFPGRTMWGPIARA